MEVQDQGAAEQREVGSVDVNGTALLAGLDAKINQIAAIDMQHGQGGVDFAQFHGLAACDMGLEFVLGQLGEFCAAHGWSRFKAARR